MKIITYGFTQKIHRPVYIISILTNNVPLYLDVKQYIIQNIRYPVINQVTEFPVFFLFCAGNLRTKGYTIIGGSL